MIHSMGSWKNTWMAWF